MPTVAELKAKLRSYGLPVSGVKRISAERISKARAKEIVKRIRRGNELNRLPALPNNGSLEDKLKEGRRIL